MYSIVPIEVLSKELKIALAPDSKIKTTQWTIQIAMTLIDIVSNAALSTIDQASKPIALNNQMKLLMDRCEKQKKEWIHSLTRTIWAISNIFWDELVYGDRLWSEYYVRMNQLRLSKERLYWNIDSTWSVG
jgi:hypothetical protein